MSDVLCLQATQIDEPNCYIFIPFKKNKKNKKKNTKQHPGFKVFHVVTRPKSQFPSIAPGSHFESERRTRQINLLPFSRIFSSHYVTGLGKRGVYGLWFLPYCSRCLYVFRRGALTTGFYGQPCHCLVMYCEDWALGLKGGRLSTSWTKPRRRFR